MTSTQPRAQPKVPQSPTLYQQIKAIAEADQHRLVSFQADLTKTDRASLQTVRPGDQWVWVLRECGTDLIPCPLTAADDLLHGGVNEYDAKISVTIRKNAAWLAATANEHMRSARTVQARAFHLVCTPTGEQTVNEISADDAVDLMRHSRWEAFDDWRESVLAMASSMTWSAPDLANRDDWWNTAAVEWTALDWLEHHRAEPDPDAAADPKAHVKQIAALVIDAMQSTAFNSSGDKS